MRPSENRFLHFLKFCNIVYFFFPIVFSCFPSKGKAGGVLLLWFSYCHQISVYFTYVPCLWPCLNTKTKILKKGKFYFKKTQRRITYQAGYMGYAFLQDNCLILRFPLYLLRKRKKLATNVNNFSFLHMQSFLFLSICCHAILFLL